MFDPRRCEDDAPLPVPRNRIVRGVVDAGTEAETHTVLRTLEKNDARGQRELKGIHREHDISKSNPGTDGGSYDFRINTLHEMKIKRQL